MEKANLVIKVHLILIILVKKNITKTKTFRNVTEILAIEHGPIRPPFSNEALVKVSTVSLNRGELRRAQNASDGALQIGWDFVGTVDAQAADGSGPTEGTRVVGFSTRMEAWSEYVSIPSNYIAPIPETVSDAQAATLPVATASKSS